MADSQQPQAKRPESSQKPKKKPNLLVRIIAFLLVAAVALGALAAVIFRDKLNMDTLRRWVQYRTLLRNDDGQADSFLYGGELEDAFAVLDGDLLVCSGNAVSLYASSGTQYINESITMDHPVVSSNGTLAVAYDAGGTSLYVLGERSLLWSKTDFPVIYSARLNQSGQLTVVTEASGYRSAITVYSTEFEPVATVNISSSLAVDAALSDDGRTLAILTVGQDGGSFASTLSYYNLNYSAGSYSPDVSCSLGSAVVLDMKHASSQLWAVSDQGLTVTNHSGETQNVGWNGKFLRSYHLGGDGFAVALLGKFKAGSQAELWVMNEAGQSTIMSLDEQVLSISVSGRYIGILTGDRLDIYTSDLKLYSSLEGTENARKVLLLEDGSAILISAATATYYIPA